LHTAPTDDAISIALHTALSHLDKRNTHVRMLLIDYSSAFNTIVHSKLITKLKTLGLNTEHAPILIEGVVVEQVESFKFLGVHIIGLVNW
jgi:RNA-binding protein YlmH